jgi:hypothetical protein
MRKFARDSFPDSENLMIGETVSGEVEKVGRSPNEFLDD